MVSVARIDEATTRVCRGQKQGDDTNYNITRTFETAKKRLSEFNVVVITELLSNPKYLRGLQDFLEVRKGIE